MRGLAWSIAVVVSCAALQGSAAEDGRPAAADTTVCTVSGTDAADELDGTSGADVICGGGGDDVIHGGGGDDAVFAGAGDDHVYGGGGSDQLFGGSGSDVVGGGIRADLIRGGAGGDHLVGRRGVDELRGESGDDSVVGGRGQDRLFGGAGHDTLLSRDRAPYDRLDGGRDRNLCVADASDRRFRCGRPLDARHRRGVPILMYHVIQAPTASTPLPGLYVAPSVFAAQMRWLAHHHFHAVTLQLAYDYWHGAPLPSRPIVISFDDGFRDHYTKALPILNHHRWPGTLNLALSHFAQHGWGLGPRMINAMIRNDWELDSHTMTHASLPGLPPDQLNYEVAHSRESCGSDSPCRSTSSATPPAATTAPSSPPSATPAIKAPPPPNLASRAGPSPGHSTASASPTPPARATSPRYSTRSCAPSLEAWGSGRVTPAPPYPVLGLRAR